MLDERQVQRAIGVDRQCAHGFDINCETCRLRELCMPASLEQGEIQALESIIEYRLELPANTPVYHDGDPFTCLYAILDGAVKACSTSGAGEVTITSFHFPGELFGFSGIDQGRYLQGAITLVDSVLCRLPFDELEHVCRDVPGLQSRLVKLMSGRIVGYEEHLALIRCTRSANARLAMFLLSLSLRLAQGAESGRRMRLPMTGQDIGNYVGISAEAVSRGLGRLVADGLIDKQQREITFLDLKGLREMACS